jgi:hypothetical protein
MNTIVLFGSSRRVGKDTAAALLVAELAKIPGIFTYQTSFAAALRQEVDQALNVESDLLLPSIDVNTQDAALKEEIVRPMLIAWGKWRRHQDPDYWAQACAMNIRGKFGRHPEFRHRIAVISDWRYTNETEPLFSLGRVIRIHLSRQGVTPTGDEGVQDPLCKAVADFRWENNGTVDDLARKVHAFLYSDLLHPKTCHDCREPLTKHTFETQNREPLCDKCAARYDLL